MDDNDWGIGITSSFDMNLARERGAYQQAQLNYNGAVRALESVQQDVLLEVMQTVTSVRQAQARVALQEQSVMQAEKQLELAELRYKVAIS